MSEVIISLCTFALITWIYLRFQRTACPSCKKNVPRKATVCRFCGLVIEREEAWWFRNNWIWPDLDTPEGTNTAVYQDVGAAVLCSAASLWFVAIGKEDWWTMLDSVVFATVAGGVWKRSKVAAVGGVALYLIETLHRWATVGPKNPLVALFLILAFINGARGVFASKRKGTDPV